MAQLRIAKPVIYGTIATFLGKKSEDKKTHSWICYVRGVNNEDLSYFIDKVVFVLHSSFDNPNREVKQHPFVISETGWGQFEILIKIFIKGDYDQPLTITHMLKLYQNQSMTQQPNKRPVVSEQYEEIVFVNPRPEVIGMLNQAMNGGEKKGEPDEEAVLDQKEVDMEAMTAAQQLKYLSAQFTVFDEAESRSAIEKALQIVSQELLYQSKRKTQQLDMEIQELQLEIENCQSKLQQ